MAIRYAISAGNWATPGIWDNGLGVPAAGDTVYANSFAVQITTDVTIYQLARSALGSPVIANGGTFVVNPGVTLNITGDIPTSLYGSTAGGTITFGSAVGSQSATINMVSSTPPGSSTGTFFISCTGIFLGTITINASGTCTAQVTATGAGIIQVPSSASLRTINVNLVNATAGVGSAAVGVVEATGSLSTVNIDISGTLSGGGTVFSCSGSGAIMNLHWANQTCATAGGNQLVYCSAGTLTITNCVVRGSSGGGPCVNNYLGGSGKVTFRNCTFYPGSYTSSIAPAVDCSVNTVATNRTRISGDIYHGGIVANTGNPGASPILGNYDVDTAGNGLRIHLLNDTNWPNPGTETILTAYGPNLPLEEDVRDGVLFGPSGINVGTMSIPDPATVAAGVPVGDTVGVGAVRLSDIAAITGAQTSAAIDVNE